MNILFVAGFFLQKRSSAAVRNNALVEGLRALGHNVFIKTFWPPVFNTSLKFVTNLDVSNNHRSINKIEANCTIKNEGIGSRNKLSIFIRKVSSLVFPDPYIFSWLLRPCDPKVDYNSIDLVISSSDSKSSHFVARSMRKKCKNAQWVQIWGDPWYLDIGLQWYHKLPAAYFEKHFIIQSDFVFYISQLTMNIMKKRLPLLKRKMYFLPRSFYKEVYSDKKRNGIIDIMYPGSVGRQRDIRLFSKVIENFNKSSDVKINLHIYTGNNEFANDYKEFNSVKFHAALEYLELLDEFKKMDAFLFLENHGASGQIPGKLFDYLGTNLPVICLMQNRESSDCWKFLKSFENCFCVEYKEESINNVTNKLVAFCNKRFRPNKKYSPSKVAQLLLQTVYNEI